MSNNPILFNAALAGGIGGINTSRWIQSVNSADYANARNDAVLFATAVDAAIPTDPDVNEQNALLLQSICEQILVGKGATGVTSQIAASIAALYSLLAAQLQPISDVIAPLTQQLFFDAATTVDAAERNGFIGTPFASLPEAALALGDLSSYTLSLSPGAYVDDFEGGEDAVIKIEGTSNLDELGNVGGGLAVLPIIAGSLGNFTSASWYLTNVYVAGNIESISPGRVVLTDMQAEVIDAATVEATDSQINASVTCDSLTARRNVTAASVIMNEEGNATFGAGCAISSFTMTGGTMTALESTFGPITAPTTAMTLSRCKLDGAVNAANLTIYDCDINANITATALTIDLASYNQSLGGGFTITAGTITFSDTSAIVSQIGWDPAGASNLLTVLPAGHAEGMYEVSIVLIVRTASGGVVVGTLTWTSPTFGAENKVMTNATNIATTGTSFINTNTTTAPHRTVNIMSTGATAITFQMGAGAAGGVVDIYASARLIGK